MTRSWIHPFCLASYLPRDHSTWPRAWRLLAPLLLAAVWSLLAWVPAAQAQGRGGDEGAYRILQARYGTEAYNVDVTQRLKALAREDRTFRMGNVSFGVDPVPGQRKTLRIFARGPDGQIRTFEYAEGSRVDGALFSSWRRGDWGDGAWQGGWSHGERGRDDGRDSGSYLILQASYGTAERHVDVTDQLKQLARRDLQFRNSNSTFGLDPDPGHRKVLRIYARSRDGQVQVFEYREDSLVDGQQFTAWGSGQWGHGGWQGGWGSVGPQRPGSHQGPPAAAGRLNILHATYGADGRYADVTARLRDLERRGRLDIQADNHTLGVDPAPGRRKVLQLTYTLRGQQHQVQVDEDQRLSIP